MIGLDVAEVFVGLKHRQPDLDAHEAEAQPLLPVGRWRDLRCRRKQGDLCFVDLSVNRYEETEPKFTAVARDVTERRRLQREIAQRVTAEQQAIGRTLHDGVAQYLAAGEMMVGVLRRRLGETAGPAADAAADLLRVIQDAQQQLRAVMRGVLPYTVQAAGLEAALQELAATIRQRHGIDCVVERHGAEEITQDPLSATQLYYIASEAVHNVVRHAHASRAVIGITVGRNQTVLTIADDGVGIAPESDKHGAGMGIMRYRASLIDADLTVRKAADGGTVVVCAMNVPD
jgi:signal transduction histidine kinase